MATEGENVVRLDVGDGLFVQLPPGSPESEEGPASRPVVPWAVRWAALSVGFGLSALALSEFGVSSRGLLAAALLPVLSLLAAIDLYSRILPNRIVLPVLGFVLAYRLALFPHQWAEWVLGMLGGAAVILLPCLLRPGAMGMGDVKLAALLGAALGRDVVAALTIGFVAVLPAALAVLIRQGTSGRAATLPLGPFLALGGTVGLLS